MERVPGKPEQLERSVDHELAEILSGAELAGLGANGVVFRVRGDSIPASVAEDLKRLGESAEVPADVAMKMLKVYEAGTAVREVRMQQKAWEALREVSDNPEFAQVPRVYFAHTAHFDESEQRRLSELGFTVGAAADIILMDFVDGRDVKEILAEQVMERSEGATPSQIQKTTDPNSDYRYGFLKKRGFTLHSSIAEKVKRTMDLLHRKGVYHNDLHEANIMVDGDPTGPDCQVSVVDFGLADASPRREYSDQSTPDDFMVVRRIEAHQPERGGQLSEDEQQHREDMLRLRERAADHQIYGQFRTAFILDHEQALKNIRVNDERTLTHASVQLLGALQEKLISPDDAEKIIARLKRGCRILPVKRKLDYLLRFIQSPEA